MLSRLWKSLELLAKSTGGEFFGLAFGDFFLPNMPVGDFLNIIAILFYVASMILSSKARSLSAISSLEKERCL